MISDKDRSGYIGASDVQFVIGNWKTKSFETWWMKKLGINHDHFDNKYTLAGTHYEHKILTATGYPMEFDRQIILEDLRLRVNLDGDDGVTNYECKTYKWEKGFKLPKKYINQCQVQMLASGLRQTKLQAYGLTDADYDNFFLPIDLSRLSEHIIAYDEAWINTVYLPRHMHLAKCLKEGRFP